MKINGFWLLIKSRFWGSITTQIKSPFQILFMRKNKEVTVKMLILRPQKFLTDMESCYKNESKICNVHFSKLKKCQQIFKKMTWILKTQ